MATAENIEFFKKHNKQLDLIVGKLNGKRVKSGIEPLSEAQVDDVITQARIWIESGSTFADFVPLIVMAVDSPQRTFPISTTGPRQSQEMKFIVSRCENGFVVKVSEGKSYICGNRKQLSEIIGNEMFGE